MMQEHVADATCVARHMLSNSSSAPPAGALVAADSTSPCSRQSTSMVAHLGRLICHLDAVLENRNREVGGGVGSEPEAEGGVGGILRQASAEPLQ